MDRNTTQQKKTRAAEILRILRAEGPELRCELDFETPLQLAVAAILAAQCTDRRVNQVTPALFRKYPDAKAYAEAELSELEEDVRTTGFFRNKARSIQRLGQALVRDHGGILPRDLESLVSLPGIGRKTANLLMADAFGEPGMIVDTHQLRVNERLGLTEGKDADRVEQRLRDLIPAADWTDWSHAITLHGRYTCFARNPKCAQCPIAALCPSRE